MDDPYVPAQHGKDGGLQEATDFRSLAKSQDKSSIPNRDPTHTSGGKRKRGVESEPEVLWNWWAATHPLSPVSEAGARFVNSKPPRQMPWTQKAG